MRLRLWVGITASVVLLSGCGSQPIPMVVVEGTTAMITIPWYFEVGYGRAWASNPAGGQPAYSQSTGLEDLQRGEMIFTLLDTANVERGKLPVRFITRVALDPAASNYSNIDQKHTQALALVDIPGGLVSDLPPQQASFGIKIERYRRDSAGTFRLVPQTYAAPWYGWGSIDGGPGAQLIPITIVDAPGATAVEQTRYTPLEGWDQYNGWVYKGFVAAIETTKPFPEFRIQLPSITTPRPYAWELEITYPANRMGVTSVRALRAKTSGSLVSWTASPGTTGPCTTNLPGTLKIQVVDPEPNQYERALGVAVVFSLGNLNDASCRAPITIDDISVVASSIKGYSLDGALQTPAPQFAIVASDLK